MGPARPSTWPSRMPGAPESPPWPILDRGPIVVGLKSPSGSPLFRRQPCQPESRSMLDDPLPDVWPDDPTPKAPPDEPAPDVPAAANLKLPAIKRHGGARPGAGCKPRPRDPYVGATVLFWQAGPAPRLGRRGRDARRPADPARVVRPHAERLVLRPGRTTHPARRAAALPLELARAPGLIARPIMIPGPIRFQRDDCPGRGPGPAIPADLRTRGRCAVWRIEYEGPFEHKLN